MAIHVTCDLCGHEPALDLRRMIPILTKEGRRVIVALRVSVDEGEADAKPVDIGAGCLKKLFKDFQTKD